MTEAVCLSTLNFMDKLSPILFILAGLTKDVLIPSSKRFIDVLVMISSVPKPFRDSQHAVRGVWKP